MRAQTLWIGGGLALAGALYAYSRTRQGAQVLSAVTQYVGDLVSNRGLRDNNPGNIRRSATTWQGELTREQIVANGGTYDPDFEQFSTPAQGVRALGHVLTTYANKYGLRTVRGIVSRYAPPSENDTEDYIADVASQLGVDSRETLDISLMLPELAAAIMRRETGYTDDLANITAQVYS